MTTRALFSTKEIVYVGGLLVTLPFTATCAMDRCETDRPAYVFVYKAFGSILLWPLSVPWYAVSEIRTLAVERAATAKTKNQD